MGEPWLSVILPTFCGAPWVGDCLASVVESVGDDAHHLEVLVVDDRSDDSTLHIVRSFASVLPLRIVERSGARNWVAGSNEGLAEARGAFCCFLHQDDRWLPDRWRLLRNRLGGGPAPDLWLSAARFIDARGRGVGHWRCPLPPGDVEPTTLHERLIVQNFVAIPAPVFRTDRLLRLALRLDETLWYTADWDFWLRLVRGAGRVVYESVPTVEFRIHGESQTVLRSLEGGAFRRQLETVLERHSTPELPASARRAARLSVEINLALAALAHRQIPAIGKILAATLAAGPGGWQRVLRDARLLERVPARLRALSG